MTIEEAREVLGISADATEEETRKAYRRKVTHAHPDRPQGNAWWFRRLGEARDVLLAPETVQGTDHQGEEPTSQGGTEDASGRLHPLVREALDYLADDAATEGLERLLGCRASATQTAVRTFLSVLRGPQRTRRKRKKK